jgi:hypothetical protein
MSDLKTIQKFRDAQELFQQERWRDALRLFDDLSLSYKSDKEIMLNRAMCLARLGKEEEAELLCDHITIVHKDPRGALLKSQIPRSRRDEKNAPAEKKHRKPLISTELLKRALIACFVVALGVAGWSFYSAYEAPVPPAIRTMDAPGTRTLRFPEESILGTLFIRDWAFASVQIGADVGTWVEHGSARGKVEIPAGKEVRLVFSPAQSANLSALRRLGKYDLQSLDLHDCPVGDAGMAHIAHLTGLFELSIDNTLVGPAGYTTLRRMTSIRVASIIATTLGDPGRRFIGQQPYLEHIDADRADLNDDWLLELPAMDRLTFLSLDDTEGITDRGIAEIAKHRNIENLFLSYTKLSDEGLKKIQSIKTMRRLWMEGTQITDASMEGFRQMPSIAEIGVAYTAVSNEGLMRLVDISTLKKVGIKGCDNITADAVKRFQAQRPEVLVETHLNLL